MQHVLSIVSTHVKISHSQFHEEILISNTCALPYDMSIDCWWLFEKLHYYFSLVIFSILQLCILFIFWSKDDDTITLFLYFWHLYKSTLWGFPFLNISTVVSMHVYMSWYAFILYKISFPSPLIRLSSPTCMQVQRMLLEQSILPFPSSSPSNLCVTDLQHRSTKE